MDFLKISDDLVRLINREVIIISRQFFVERINIRVELFVLWLKSHDTHMVIRD